MSNDPFNLNRFLTAQENSNYKNALGEISSGRKTGHWIWYVFPQMSGLGRSEQSRYYGIDSLAEARAYFEHPILGARLIEITDALIEQKSTPLVEIVGVVDSMKIQSCMTLFRVASGNAVFDRAIEIFFDDIPCSVTLEMLKAE
jgi:uncharacterized protein (DUF1810 family)